MPRPLPDPPTLPPGVRPTPTPGSPVSVSGGAGGIEAYSDELNAVAQRLGGCGLDLGGASAGLHPMLFDVGEWMSGAFDPIGAVRVEEALAAALDGPHGLSLLAAQCGFLDGALRAAAVAYEAADTLDATLTPIIDALAHLPGAAAALAELDYDFQTGNWSELWNDLQGVLTADPALAVALIRYFQPLLATLAAGLRVPPTKITSQGDDTSGVAGIPPRNVTDLLSDLAQRDEEGGIDVRILTYPDGTRRVIVDITGMKTFDPVAYGNVTNPSYANQAMFGDDTAYENGVLAAMRAAGVTATDDVMLVGHSEGGMVAVNAARDAVNSGRYNVTHVITAGSPIAMTAGSVPSSVQVLAVENQGDVVPQLDGAVNPAGPNVTTVTVNHNDGIIGDDHGLETAYLPGANDIDTSTNQSILSYLNSASDFLDATSVETKTYQVSVG